METLAAISEQLANVTSRAGSSLVSVQGRRTCATSGISWAKDLVITSLQAIDREEKLDVVLASGQRLPAERVGAHPASDLAVLRVSAELAPLSFAEPSQLRVGELVLALGRQGAGIRARLGVLSVLGGEWRAPGGARFERYIESDLPPGPGLSGGALVRANGELIGFNTGALVRGALLTLPASSVAGLVEALVTHGRVRRAHLGVAVHSVRLPQSASERLKLSAGLIVLSVQPGSVAERVGLLLGDVILALGEDAVARVEELEALLGEAAIGKELELRLLRAGEELRLRVQPEERN